MFSFPLKGIEKINQYSNKVNDNPLVSICVQTYNHENYIKECLEGILMQNTTFDFEILLGEDDSSDKTREICIEYANKYPTKIRLFLHDRSNVIYIHGNATGRYNFIYNLSEAKGKYIALCEGDDYWTDSYKLQKQVDFLEANEEYVVTYHDYHVIDENSNIVEEDNRVHNKKDFTEQELRHGAFMKTLTLCFRNNSMLFPPEFLLLTNADKFLISLLGQYGKSKYMSDIKTGAYRIHSSGIWSLINSQKREYAQQNSMYQLFKYYKRLSEFKETQYFFFRRFTNFTYNILFSLTKEKRILLAIFIYFKYLFISIINGYLPLSFIKLYKLYKLFLKK